MPSRLNAVTGATGLLGSYLAEQLLGAGERVRALVRPTSDTAFLEQLGVELIEGDLGDEGAVQRLVAGTDLVYHCAAKTDNWGAWSEYAAATIEATRRVVEACRKEQGVKRLLFVSSMAVYGHPPRRRERIAEDAPLGQRLWLWDYYTRSKIEAERAVRQLGPRATIIRPTWIYGPRELSNIPSVLRAVRKRAAWLIGSGDNLLNMIYAGDVAEAAILAANRPIASGQAYNVCTYGELAQRQLMEILSDAVGVPRVRRRIPHPVAHAYGFICEAAGRLLHRKRAPLVTRHGLSVFLRRTAFSYEKARSELGWAPKVHPREGLQRTLQWLQSSEATRRIASRGR